MSDRGEYVFPEHCPQWSHRWQQDLEWPMLMDAGMVLMVCAECGISCEKPALEASTFPVRKH